VDAGDVREVDSRGEWKFAGEGSRGLNRNDGGLRTADRCLIGDGNVLVLPPTLSPTPSGLFY
jgi:hypothetical protein